MSANKAVTVKQMEIVKAYIDEKDEKAFKSAECTENTIRLYKTADKSGEAVEITLPAAKISAEEGNSLIQKADGLYAPTAQQTEIEYAADEEVHAVFDGE